MVKMTFKPKNLDQQEINAFVHQQMMELEPHIDTKSPLEMTLTQNQAGGFMVSLVAEHTEGRVQTVGTGPDVFGAIRSAKEGLLEYCVAVEAEINPQQRSQKIDDILSGNSHYLH